MDTGKERQHHRVASTKPRSEHYGECKDHRNLGHDIEGAELETGEHHGRSMPSAHQQQEMAYQVLDHHNQPNGPFQTIQFFLAVIAFKNKLAPNFSDFYRLCIEGWFN